MENNVIEIIDDNTILGYLYPQMSRKKFKYLKNILSKSFIITKTTNSYFKVNDHSNQRFTTTNKIDMFSWLKVAMTHMIINCNTGKGVHLTEYKELYDPTSITNIDEISEIHLYGRNKKSEKDYYRVFKMKFDESKTTKNHTDRAFLCMYGGSEYNKIAINEAVNENIRKAFHVGKQSKIYETCNAFRYMLISIGFYISENSVKIFRQKTRNNISTIFGDNISNIIKKSLLNYASSDFFDIEVLNELYDIVSYAIHKQLGVKLQKSDKKISLDMMPAITSLSMHDVENLLKDFKIETETDNDKKCIITTKGMNKMLNLK